MTTQIAVRLPEELVAFVDSVVETGTLRSRAAVVAHALERERRRVIASRDVQIIRNAGSDADLDALAGYSAAHVPTLD